MPTLDDLLAPYPPEVQRTARRARALILDVLPDAALGDLKRYWRAQLDQLAAELAPASTPPHAAEEPRP